MEFSTNSGVGESISKYLSDRCLHDGAELYSHKSDSQKNDNFANQPENAELVKRLTAQLADG